MNKKIDNDKEIACNKRDSRIEELENRIRYCEAVAQEYKNMFKQLEQKLKALDDRQGNIQMVYDYLTRVGSDLTKNNPNLKRTLNPISKTLSPTDEKYLELIKIFKFKLGDKVYYANEGENYVSDHMVNGIDIFDKHHRYTISEIFGYVDEHKLFTTESEAQSQLNRWKLKII